MIDLIPGGVPTGENLFGRDELISDLWRKLEQDNILLLAPRRFGKTGIMRKMQDEPRKGFAVVFLDCEKIRDPESFLVELIFELLKNSRARKILKTAKYLPGTIVNKATKRLKEIELWKMKFKFREVIGHNWGDKGNDFLKIISDLENRTLIILDEFPWMIENMEGNGVKGEDIQGFLEWLRSVRLDQDHYPHLRFVFGGSTSLHFLLNKVGARGSCNDLVHFHISPFTKAIAKEFLRQLLQSVEVELNEKSRAKIFTLIGPAVPYFIQIFVSQIWQSKLPSIDLTENKIEEIYRERVIGPPCKAYFKDYEDRLEKYGRVRHDLARKILGALAKAKTLPTRALYDIYKKADLAGEKVDFDEIMADLETDFYIKRVNDEYSFVCRVLRDWWLRWHPSLEIGD